MLNGKEGRLLSSLQWTFLGVGLGLLLLGASLIRWADQIEQRVSVEGNIYLGGGWMLVCGVLFLIGVAATGVGSFTYCILGSEQGIGELVADAVWLGIAVWLLVDGTRTHNGGQIGASAFMFAVVGLFGLLTWVFHAEDKWVKTITDFCGCF
jgi:hypothetical protein